MKIVAYEIEDCGIDHAQYFPGRVVNFTRWDHCFVGAGDTPYDAVENAIEQLADSDLPVDVDSIVNDLSKNSSELDKIYEESEDTEEFELYYYAALYIKVE